LHLSLVTDETTIRQRLIEACSERGVQAEIAKCFSIHPSTVKRWLEGGDIPPPMLKLLDWYFFGTLPPSLVKRMDVRGTLDLSADEWAILVALAKSQLGKANGTTG
jgi:hypothetical protein